VGFTRIAEGLSPQALVGELDRRFRRFDRIIGRRNLEKIKTIGDAYMAAGGVPEPGRTHAVDCVLAALEMQWSMEALRADAVARGDGGRPPWPVRVGVHSGDLVAGVIGRRKFSYDVWGDTVNTASRMESAGQPGRVNVSGATHERVRDFFLCEYRGRLPAKNKGEIDMYFVNGIRPELSADAAGRTPNAEFARRYRDLIRGATSPIAPHIPADADPISVRRADLAGSVGANC
jgi:adenylate cyclase